MNDTSQDAPHTPATLVREWWADLQQRRGERAELRRAHSLLEIEMQPAYQRLRRRMAGTPWTHPGRLAVVAAVLARVERDDTTRSFAAQLARPRAGGERAAFSGLRFRRLLQREAPEELIEPMGRAVRQMGSAAHVADLAEGLYWWNDRTRRDWAFAYYDTNPQAE